MVGNTGVLDISHVSKSFGGIKAVKDVSFSVKGESVLGIIGPNGSGKTTLINMITGLVRPDSGKIAFDGIELTKLPMYAISRLGIVRTMQSVKVFSKFTVEQNVAMAATAVGEKEIGEEARVLLDSFGLSKYTDKLAEELSYGQQKLLELTTTFIRKPKLILLDEPSAGVNPVIIEEIVSYIDALINAGKTLIVVEHNIPFVKRISHKLIAMSQGQIIAHGTSEEVVKDNAVLESLLGGGLDVTTHN